ncbi:MAG: protein kinase [Dokdonella sp.]
MKCYAATRSDAAFEQRAALKLLRYEAVAEIDRFQSERRILAKFEHAGIARLLDGGMAPDGRPYTVMEYVEGQSITDYCRARASSLHERRALFAAVCEAVAFAHRHPCVPANGDSNQRREHVDTMQIEMRLGRILFDSGRTQEGLALLQTAKQRALDIRGADDPEHTPLMLTEYGLARARMGLLQEGLVDLQAAIANRRINRPGTNHLATSIELMASDLVEQGLNADALIYLDEATSIKMSGGIAPRSARYNFNTGTSIRLALAEGHTETARSLVNELFVDADETLGISFAMINQWLFEAEIELAQGRSMDAAELARRVRDKLESSGLVAHLPFYAMRADMIEGEAALPEKRPAVALPLLQRTLAQREKILAASSARIAEAKVASGECKCELALAT